MLAFPVAAGFFAYKKLMANKYLLDMGTVTTGAVSKKSIEYFRQLKESQSDRIRISESEYQSLLHESSRRGESVSVSKEHYLAYRFVHKGKTFFSKKHYVHPGFFNKHNVGSPIKVVYLAKEPTRNQILEMTKLGSGTKLFILFGFLLLAVFSLPGLILIRAYFIGLKEKNAASGWVNSAR